MTGADFTVAFALGLAGSLHCVVMCGPLVISAGLPIASTPRSQQIAAQGAYHAGRILTYSLLGAAAGAFGSGVAAVGSLARLENAAALVAGGLMMLAALLMCGAIRRPTLIQIGPAARLSSLAGRLLRTATVPHRFLLGAAMGLLPCGLIYAALLKAMAPADALTGAMTMLAFGLGTAGPLFGLGVLPVPFGRRLARWGTPVTAAAVGLMGLALIWRAGLPVTMAGLVHPH